MTSLVLDLQKESCDSKISISTLLRKALIVAKKLNIKDFEKWIKYELEGYDDINKLPKYRKVHGEVRGFNPFHGWQVVMIDDRKFAELLSTRKISQPIANLESAIKNTEGNTITLSYPAPIEEEVSKFLQPKTHIALFIDKSQFEGIIDYVRNIVLKWALKLEEDGIKGENMSFSSEEKTKATNTTYNVNNFYGPVTDTQIQQSTQDSTQIIDKKTLDIDTLKDLIKEIKENIKEVKLGDKKQEFESEIKTIETQMDSPNPKPKIIRESLNSIRHILEGAAGSLIASGLMYRIGQFLGL